MSEELESTPAAGAEKALDALESAADVTDTLADISVGAKAVEEAAEASAPVVPFVVTVGVVAIGAAVGGYFFAKHRLRTRYEAIAQKEIQEAKAFYSKLGKAEGYSSPDEAMDTLHPSNSKRDAAVTAIKDYQGRQPGPDILEEDESVEEDDPDMPPEEEEGGVNVVLQEADENGWDWDEEIARRVTANTYVITHEEFAMNESGYDQETVFWFEGDGVATSYDEKPLSSPAKQLGMENLTRFGVQSIDPNIVYIRNVQLELDMEVVRREGKYVDEVLGFRHADEPFSYRRKGSFNRGE